MLHLFCLISMRLPVTQQTIYCPEKEESEHQPKFNLLLLYFELFFFYRKIQKIRSIKKRFSAKGVFQAKGTLTRKKCVK
jgi:hypothetical protein